tara:strand:+ start:2880 stop:3125 length:246 start_codon:yes stop_codon:yes gene_type:complete
MTSSKTIIEWPNQQESEAETGQDWLYSAKLAGINIPTGCLGGSCGACEIEVNGEVIRACISKVQEEKSGRVKVEFSYDPFW